MTRKETGKTLFCKFARAMLIASLSFACLMSFPYAAHAQSDDNGATGTGNDISPRVAEQAFGSRWRDVLRSYKEADARFAKKQQERLKKSQPLAFVQKKDINKLIKTYPFLKKDLQFTLDTQKTAEDYVRQHPSSTVDTTTHIYIARNDSPDGKNNLLFLEERGNLFCAAHGCPITVYVGNGNQYVTAMNYIGDNDINVARTNGQISLFFSPQMQIQPVEWVLKGDKFEKNPPPPTASQSSAYLQWLHKHTKHKAPQGNNNIPQQQQSPWGTPAPSAPETSTPSAPPPPQPGSSNDTIVPAAP